MIKESPLTIQPVKTLDIYLTTILQARTASESIANEAEGRMGYWLRGHEGKKNNCFCKILLVGRKNIETEHLSLVKARVFI